MRIHQDFTGGNIAVKEEKEGGFVLGNELRDTTEDWFYWAFCIEGAEGRELTFEFDANRLGYFGPAVSHDLVHWHCSAAFAAIPLHTALRRTRAAYISRIICCTTPTAFLNLQSGTDLRRRSCAAATGAAVFRV